MRLPALILLLCAAAQGAFEPMMAETKAQIDLENALSRVLRREEFLLQVSSDVTHEPQRRLVEGESFVMPSDSRARVPIMPGFVPEPDVPLSQRVPSPERQVYRMIEVAVLKALRVRIDFDDGVAPETIARAKTLVKDYLSANFGSVAMATFGRIPMISSSPKRSPAGSEEVNPPSPWDLGGYRAYLPWAIAGLLGLIVLFLVSRQGRSGRRRRRAPSANPLDALRSLPFFPGMQGNPSDRASYGTGPGRAAAHDDDPESAHARKVLLEKFLAKADAFRLYYKSLTEEKQRDICGLLGGPAFESLLEGLGLVPPPGADMPPANVEECLEYHEKIFDDYAKAREWQQRRLFGFLQQMSHEQLIAFFNQETPLGACLMLRSLRPAQSAFVLDAMSPGRRSEVLSMIPDVMKLPLSEIAEIEREARASVQKLPTHLYGYQREDIDYWGRVLTEAQDQEAILKVLERTSPELYPALKPYRFKLEDAAGLPPKVIDKVMSDVDNDELALALVTLPVPISEALLESLSPKRRDIMTSQIAAFQGSSPERTKAARIALAKRFREAMAA